jgi:hypothetical protein
LRGKFLYKREKKTQNRRGGKIGGETEKKNTATGGRKIKPRKPKRPRETEQSTQRNRAIKTQPKKKIQRRTKTSTQNRDEKNQGKAGAVE